MKCTYTYKGVTFNSEAELDDFLLEKRKFESKYGDAIFSKSARVLQAQSILDDMAKEAALSDAEFEEAKRNAADVEDDTILKFRRPRIGVNEWIAGRTNPETGRLLTPEFRDREFWQERINRWTTDLTPEDNGDWSKRFSDDEIDMFFEADPSATTKEEKHQSRLSKLRKLTQEEAQKLKAIMLRKWAFQNTTGTALHFVMQQYFGKCTVRINGEDREINVRDLGMGKYHARGNPGEDTYVPTIESYIKEQINTELRSQMGRKFRENIVDDVILAQLINYADRLHRHLKSDACIGDDNLQFFTEFKIIGNPAIVGPGEPNKVMGIIDLMVMDSKGRIHIFDYKTSPKDYDHFDSAKKRAFYYQMATYAKILRQHGLNYDNSTIRIIPLQLDGLELTNQNEALLDPAQAKFEYTGIKWPDDITKDITPELNRTASRSGNSILDDIDTYFPEVPIKDASSENMLQHTRDTVSEWFPGYTTRTQEVSEEEIDAELRGEDGYFKDSEGNYIYRPKGMNKKTITAKSEEELRKEVIRRRKNEIKRRNWVTTTIINALKWGQKNNSSNIEPFISSINSKYLNDPEGTATWFKDNLAQYCNSDWTIVEQPSLEALGIIVLRNKVNVNQIKVLKISNSYLKYNRHIGGKNRTLLCGAFSSDLQENSKPNSLMLKGITGNVELMETIVALNELPSLFQGQYANAIIDNIQVINPSNGTGISATNEELLYCYKVLSEHSPMKGIDHIKTGTIKFATMEQSLNLRMSALFDSDLDYGISDKSKFTSARADWDNVPFGDTDRKIKTLKKLIKEIEDTYGVSKISIQQLQGQNAEIYKMYYMMLQTLAALQGVNFRQQIQQSDKYIQEKSFGGIIKNGVSGLYIDNPGNLTSQTLNLITNLTTQAYQNVRHDMTEPVAKMRELVEKLKKKKGYNAITGQVVNATSLYEDMMYMENGELRFRNINDSRLIPEQRELLEYALKLINKNRYDASEATLETWKNRDDIRYYRVPLAKASSESRAYMKGVGDSFMERLRSFTPKNALEEIRQKMEGVMNEDDESQRNVGKLFEMGTIFDKGDCIGGYSEKDRLDYIKFKGEEFFEHNIEVLTFKHVFAYSVKNNIDDVMPIIKSAMASLALQGQSQNTNFANDVQYLENYLKSKIKNQPIEEEETQQKATALASKVRQVASFMALAFSPVQGLYQSIQGIWQDISLVIRKPDGTQAFTLANMYDAAKTVYGDLFHFSDKPTKCQLLNEMYGINDMDMNTYAEKMRTDKHGIWNTWDLAFKFTSRPDFYNRMTIIIAKMKHDGIWDALEVKDGRLVYNWKKDKRFDKLNIVNGRVEGDSDQLGLYYAMAQQFVLEGVKNPDGSLFQVGQALPYCYTNKDAEGLKSYCDTIYGYYSHEKKSMVHETFIGALFMQMRTYWSGKKNQYLQPGGVRLQGHWEPAKNEEGKTMYYILNENNLIDYSQTPVTEDELPQGMPKIPVVQWKGQWQEGIIMTMANMLRNEQGGLSAGYALTHLLNLNPFISKEKLAEKFNIEEDLAQVYLSNLRQFFGDLTLYMIIGLFIGGFLLGDWDKEMQKKAKEENNLMAAVQASAVHMLKLSIHNSASDFAFWSTIGGPTIQWSPFAFETVTRLSKKWWSVITGDPTIYDGIVGSFSATKQMKPLMNYINVNYIKTDE